MCILQALSKEDTYGYPLMMNMREYFPDTDESTIYAILRRLKNEGYAESYMDSSSLGPARRYYRLTVKGAERLKEMYLEWEALIEIINKIKGG